jgi:hypothetical protein
MKKSAIMFVLCAWVVLEPPLDRNSNPNPKAPLKEWQRPSFGGNTANTASFSYWDTKKECETHEARMAFGKQKLCLPLEEYRN